ncbi:MAG: cysteine hydrolase family protein [Microthrixaceae bacterium]
MPPTPADGAAVVTMELERGVVGDLATLPQLASAATERGTLASCGRLVAAARNAGIPVVHCIAMWTGDRIGAPLNTPLGATLSKNPAQILAGTAAVELVAELGDTSADLASVRTHGMGPFHGTSLDPLLRSLGVNHVIAVGVSLNVGIPALVTGAVDRGFEVTVPTDAVVGVPPAYGDEVLANTISMLATLTDVDSLVSRWVVGR